MTRCFLVPSLTALLALGATSLLLTGSHALSQPRFTKVPVDQIGVSGSKAYFVCQATGDPKPHVSWKRNVKVVNSWRHKIIQFDDGAGSVLAIKWLEAPQDEKTYECVAKSSEGEVTTSARLSIINEDLLPAGFPSIDRVDSWTLVERTKNVTMPCAASGDPAPDITWFKANLPVDISGSNGRIKQLRSGALQIGNSEESDEGEYECVASNVKGVRHSSFASLYVQDSAPLIIIPPASQEVAAGGSVNLTCEAEGMPTPHVKWMKGEVELTKEEDRLGYSKLMLTDIHQSANYTCVARSSHGMDEATAQVTVRDPAPPRITIPPTSQEVAAGGSANLTCEADGFPKPYVKWMKGEVELTKEENRLGFNMLMLTDIHQSANYTCVARSSLGMDEATAQVTVRG